MSRIAILGSGMAACGAFHALEAEAVEATVYEARDHPGGHTASFAADGFLFDDGPHISFTRDERLQQLLADNLGGRYEVLQTRVDNLWRGHRIKHPAQVNLYGLPEDLVVRVIADFVAAQQRDPADIRHYEDWLRTAFGDTFAETFPMVYGRKYHTVEAAHMTTDWLGPRLYRPKLEEVLRGALSPHTPDVHYVSHFRYPSEGGFAAYLKPFHRRMDLRLSHRAVAIDPAARELTFAHGPRARYHRLISSVPLPELIPMIAGAPPEVIEAAALLACTQCVLVNLGVDRSDLSEAHWTYLYDDDIFFTRLSYPHMLSPANVPEGCGSLQAECYFSPKYRPLDRSPEACIEPVIRDLRRCGILQHEDRILCRRAWLVPYANVIFDLDRPAALAAVRAYLAEVGILTCGRYGEWGYHWTDEAFTSGEQAARRALE